MNYFNVSYTHSNDSHQCPILAADFVIFYYGIENDEGIQAGAGSEWGIEMGSSFSVPKQVSCEYGTLMWIFAVFFPYLFCHQNVLDKFNDSNLIQCTASNSNAYISNILTYFFATAYFGSFIESTMGYHYHDCSRMQAYNCHKNKIAIRRTWIFFKI